MAYEASQPLKHTFVAGEDLTAAQYHFVTLKTDGTIELCDAATEYPIGVLQNKPDEGQEAEVVIVGITKLVAGEDLDPLDFVSTGADGRGEAAVHGTDTTVYVNGQVIATGSSADGTIATVVVSCINQPRAVTSA